MIWPKKNNYKSTPTKSKSEADIQREIFIKKELDYQNQNYDIKNKLPKWLISLGLYLSKEGPKINDLDGGIESLKKQQIENHYLSKFILYFDIKAVEYERNIINRDEIKVEENNHNNTNDDLKKLISDDEVRENKNWKTLPETKNNVSKKKVSTLDPKKQKDYFSKYKPIINVVNNKDEYFDLGISFNKEIDSEEIFYDAKNGNNTSSSNDTVSTMKFTTPQNDSPKTPLSPSLILLSNEEENRPEIDSLKNAGGDESFFSNSSKMQKLNYKTQDRNRNFLKKLKENSDNGYDKRSNSIQTNKGLENFDNFGSFNIYSPLIKEYITPSLEVPNVIHDSGKNSRAINYDRKKVSPLEGSSKDLFLDTNEFNNSNENIKEVITNDEKRHENIIQDDKNVGTQNERDNVIFFDLEQSAKIKIKRKSSLFYNKTNNLATSLKTLRENSNKSKSS